MRLYTNVSSLHIKHMDTKLSIYLPMNPNQSYKIPEECIWPIRMRIDAMCSYLEVGDGGGSRGSQVAVFTPTSHKYYNNPCCQGCQIQIFKTNIITSILTVSQATMMYNIFVEKFDVTDSRLSVNESRCMDEVIIEQEGDTYDYINIICFNNSTDKE